MSTGCCHITNDLSCCCCCSLTASAVYVLQMKIGDLGMARHVFPPAPANSSSRSPYPLRQDPLAAVRAAAAALSPQHSGYNSGASTPQGSSPARRTFTPGIVGTITYSAPEVLGVLDEPEQQPEVETVLKVCGSSY